jgi:beta-lactamase class A
LEVEEFSFKNGIEGLEYLEELILAYIEPLWGDYSIYVKNLDTNEYLVINNRQQMPASLIKLFNMVYAFEKIENGSLEKTSSIEQWLYDSIVVSCNNSYNHLLVALGYGNAVQGAMDATEFAHLQGFDDTVVGGTLHPSYFPISGFSNVYSSALDVGHLLENIYRGTMVSEEASDQMMEILLAQQWLHKIPAGLPEGTVTASKTGEIGAIEHDAAIVFAEDTNFIIVIMTENASSAHFNIQEISRLVYDYFL